MKKKFAYPAIFLLMYSIFVIALLPANWLLTQVKLPKNISISGLEGTIWRAKVDQVYIDGVVIERVHTALSLVSVLMLDPKFEVHFGDALVPGPEGQFAIKGLWSDITIEDGQVNLAANVVSSRLNLAIDVVAHEQLQLSLTRYVMGTPLCQTLQGSLHWQNAKITALDEQVALGDLAAVLSCQQGELVAEIEPNNNLGLSYRAQIKSLQHFSGSGYLTPGDKFPEPLKAALSFLGQADKQGRYRLKN
ncbi:type II secretion system protein N (GspN) [Colwellia chukchiensis]|uniref:Type II secretion system protein N n=1 Tax=Colwellia chukchiensis TaxID=641665 RepID=A0A1H7RA34_9GAMM|nr:type II secretion system protein N [Colwellia chukchiensis]SEL57150.1 type II secretion system protein N (GspN) [Colwellia chukchiensis]